MTDMHERSAGRSTGKDRERKLRAVAGRLVESDDYRRLAAMTDARDATTQRLIHRLRNAWNRGFGYSANDMMNGIIHQADSSNDAKRLVWVLDMLARHGSLQGR